MQEAASFWGEFGGETWTTQAVAVVLAAVSASLAAAFTAWVAITQGHKTRTQEREIKSREREIRSREVWWDRFEWAADRVLSNDERQRIAGARIMTGLGTMAWMDKGDRILAAAILTHAREGADTSSLQSEAAKP